MRKAKDEAAQREAERKKAEEEARKAAEAVPQQKATREAGSQKRTVGPFGTAYTWDNIMGII